MYSLQFLEKYKLVIYTKKDNILQYYYYFNIITKVLIQQNILLIYTTRVWFLYRLLSSTIAKVIRKHSINTKDLEIVNYYTIYIYIEKSIVFEKTIQRIQVEKTPSMDQKVELEELVSRFQIVTNVTKEKRLVELVVALQPIVSTTTNKTIDKLTQLFEKLNISIGALVQQNLGQPQCLYYQHLYSRNLQLELYTTRQNVRATLQAIGVNVFTTRQNIENIYFYCYNQNLDFPLHRFHNQYLQYQHHIAIGIVHLNTNN